MATAPEPPGDDPFAPLRRSVQILDELTQGLDRRSTLGDRLALGTGLALLIGALTVAVIHARPDGDRVGPRTPASPQVEVPATIRRELPQSRPAVGPPPATTVTEGPATTLVDAGAPPAARPVSVARATFTG